MAHTLKTLSDCTTTNIRPGKGRSRDRGLKGSNGGEIHETQQEEGRQKNTPLFRADNFERHSRKNTGGALQRRLLKQIFKAKSRLLFSVHMTPYTVAMTWHEPGLGGSGHTKQWDHFNQTSLPPKDKIPAKHQQKGPVDMERTGHRVLLTLTMFVHVVL